MKYLAAMLLVGLFASALAAIPPAYNGPIMNVDEVSGGVVITPLSDNDAADFGREFPATLVGQLQGEARIRISSVSGAGGGGGTLNLTTPVVTSGGANWQVWASGMSTSLAIGADTDFRIIFAPQSAGAITGEVTFTYEADPNGAPGVYTDFRINVTGVGVASQVQVVRVEEGFPGGVDVYHQAPAVGGRKFSPRTLSAGESPAASLTVFNASDYGAPNLTIGTPYWVSGGSNFHLYTSGLPTSYPPTQGSTFQVSYEPTAPGSHTAVLAFTHDDPNRPNPFEIVLEGECLAEAAQIRVSDQAGPFFDTTGLPPQYIGTHLAEYAAPAGARLFGDVDGGQTVSLTITVCNADVGYIGLWSYTPGADLTLGTPTVVGDSDFTLDLAGYSTTVGSAGTTTFVIRFSPRQNGVRTAVIEIPHGDSSEREPFRVIVRGSGVNVSAGGSGSGNDGGGCVATGAGAGSGSWAALAILLLSLTVAVRLRRAS